MHASRSLVVLAVLLCVAVAGASASGNNGVVVTGLGAKAHYRLELAQEKLEAAIAVAGSPAGFPAIQEAFDASLATLRETARDLRTAFALAVTSDRVDLDEARFYNAAVDATTGLTARLEELLSSTASPPTGDELQRYQSELAAVRALLSDRKGGIKKLGTK